jgi:hypothetical protein
MPRTAATRRTKALPNAAKFTAVRPLIAHANALTQEARITNWYYMVFLEGHFAQSTATAGDHTIPEAARFCEQKQYGFAASIRSRILGRSDAVVAAGQRNCRQLSINHLNQTCRGNTKPSVQPDVSRMGTSSTFEGDA